MKPKKNKNDLARPPPSLLLPSLGGCFQLSEQLAACEGLSGAVSACRAPPGRGATALVPLAVTAGEAGAAATMALQQVKR